MREHPHPLVRCEEQEITVLTEDRHHPGAFAHRREVSRQVREELACFARLFGKEEVPAVVIIDVDDLVLTGATEFKQRRW